MALGGCLKGYVCFAIDRLAWVYHESLQFDFVPTTPAIFAYV